jgi:drug/metabolite transporter (DMT)-like permease
MSASILWLASGQGYKVARAHSPPPSIWLDMTPTTKRPSAVPGQALAWLVVLTLVWGLNWPLFGVALKEIPPFSFRAITLGVAALAVFALARFKRLDLGVPKAMWPRLAVAAMGNFAVWNIATAYAVLNMPSGHAALIGFSMPLWAAIIGFLFFHERLGPRHVLALVLGTLGVTLLMVEDFAAMATAPLGLALMLAAAICWAVSTQVQKRTIWALEPLTMTAWQMLIGFIPIAAGALLVDAPSWALPSARALAVSFLIGLVPVAIGTTAWFSIVRLLPANVAALSSVTVPIVAVFSGALLLGEPLGVIQFAALTATIVALALVLMQPMRRTVPAE